MQLSIRDFSQLSIQAKISFVEWIGRKMLPKLQGASFEAAANGLSLIEKWRETQQVSGDDLNLALMNEEDEGIYAHAGSQDTAEANSAIEVVGGVVSYVAWRVYRHENSRIPQEYERANDEFVQWILDQSEKSAALNYLQVANVLRHLYSHYKTPVEVLGNVVTIREIEEAANAIR